MTTRIRVEPVIYIGATEARIAMAGERVDAWGVYAKPPGEVEMHVEDFPTEAEAERHAEALRVPEGEEEVAGS